jgi:hypothetical protein
MGPVQKNQSTSAERIAAALLAAPQLLLIRCHIWPVPAQALPELQQCFDTATQITTLAQWLKQQHPLPKWVWIATDPDHTARAVLNAQIVLGPRCIQVGPPPPPASPAERRKLLRDAFRPPALALQR